jgi:hypothetical protein
MEHKAVVCVVVEELVKYACPDGGGPSEEGNYAVARDT